MKKIIRKLLCWAFPEIGSPLHKAIFNGGNLILPYSQGGVQKINVELINK